MDAINNQDPPWFIVSEDKTRVDPNTPEDIFYNDLDADEIQKQIKGLKQHSYQVFNSKLTYPAYKDIATTYMFCKKDNAISYAAQRGMVEAANIDIAVEIFDASHSPFLSMPDAVADASRRAAGEDIERIY